ncbi:MAG: hypothetical protein V9E83_07600 [Baekduia sp.]
MIEAEHRRWIIVNAVLVTALLNVVINAVIARLSALGMDEIPVWGWPLLGGTTIATDTAGTFFVLPFVTSLLVPLGIQFEIRRERLRPIAGVAQLPTVLRRLPDPVLKRALVTGAAVFALGGPLSLLGVALADLEPMSVQTFVVYKAVLGVALGLIVTPPIAMRAMAQR